MTDIATLLINDEKKQIAKKLLKLNTSIEIISEATELEIEVIEKLKEELNK